jgi:predicted nucleotidyltransferase
MPSSHSKEVDRDRAQRIARDGCILRCLVGSTVHGLSKPGTDDRDEMGVCIEPQEYVLGLREFDHWVWRTQPEGSPSGPGDLDLTIYGLRRYCRLAMKSSPTVLLLLFIDGEHVLERQPLGSELQALAPAFLSRHTGKAFLGYLHAQRLGLSRDRQAARARELAPAHGYDTKYAMHALRLAHQGHELLCTGGMTLPVPEPQRERLMEVRRGELTLVEVLARLDQQTAELERVAQASGLPERPDHEAINRFLVSAHERSWAAHRER